MICFMNIILRFLVIFLVPYIFVHKLGAKEWLHFCNIEGNRLTDNIVPLAEGFDYSLISVRTKSLYNNLQRKTRGK